MKNLKKIITLIAGTAALSAMAVTASAGTITRTVSCYKSDEQTYQSGGVVLYNFYDYGTFLPFDNARIRAEASTTGKRAYTCVYFADFGSENFYYRTNSTSVKGELIYSDYTSGDDMLEPGSYAQAQADSDDLYLRVTY